MSAVRPSAVIGRRLCAGVAACSAVLHGLMIADAGNLAVAALIVAMAVACLYCARELWTTGSPRVWCLVAVMNLGMVATHWTMPAHQHGQVVTTAALTPASTLMTVATVSSLVEAAVATAVLYLITRRHAVSSAPQWN